MRKQHVVGVHKAEHVARGARETPIHPVGRTRIGLEHNSRQPMPIALDELAAAVGRAWIDDDVLDIRMRLRQDRHEGTLEKHRLVEGDRDDADPHAHTSVAVFVQRMAPDDETPPK